MTTHHYTAAETATNYAVVHANINNSHFVTTRMVIMTSKQQVKPVRTRNANGGEHTDKLKTN